MRSPFRSSALVMSSATVVLALAGCSTSHVLGSSLPTPDDGAGELPAPIDWTHKPRRGHVADSGGSGAPDAGQPEPEPEPEPEPTDSGAQQPPPIAADAGTDTPDPVLEPSASIVFSAAPLTGVPMDAHSSFVLGALPELYVYSAWSNLVGEHSELRKYYEPSGTLFYQKLTAFSTDIDEPVPFTRSVDVPHASTVRPVVANANGQLIVDDYIGVAGTWISDHSMTGSWKVELYLDEEKTPSATRTFELMP